MFRGGFAWLNATQNMSSERQWKRKEIKSIPEYWNEMSRRSPGKKESLDSLTTREISVTEVTRISVQPLYFRNHTPTVLYNQKYKEYEITKNVEISTK